MMNARLGDNKSLIALGDMYRDGRGVRQDYKAAMNRYKKAADVGYAEAQCNIGQLHYNGQGVACDHYEAFKWYTLAAIKDTHEVYTSSEVFIPGVGDYRIQGIKTLAEQRSIISRQLTKVTLPPSAISVGCINVASV